MAADVARAAAATEAIDARVCEARLALAEAFAGRLVDKRGVYADLAGARTALSVAIGALMSAQATLASTQWPTPETAP